MFKIFRSKNWQCAYRIGYIDGIKGCSYGKNPFNTLRLFQNKFARAWTKGWLLGTLDYQSRTH